VPLLQRYWTCYARALGRNPIAEQLEAIGPVLGRNLDRDNSISDLHVTVCGLLNKLGMLSVLHSMAPTGTYLSPDCHSGP